MPDLTFIDRDGTRYQVRRGLTELEAQCFDQQRRASQEQDITAMLAALQQLIMLLVPELPPSRLAAITVGDLVALLTWWQTARFGADVFVLSA